MERKFLEELGLDKEVIDKILGEHGKGIQAEQKKLEAKEKERELTNNQLTDANNTIKSYKDMDIDEIKKSADDWAGKTKSLEVELGKTKTNAALVRQLFGLNVYDLDWLITSLDMEKITFEDDKVTGLDEQVENLKESKPFLFKEDKQVEPIDTEKERFEMIKPEPSNGAPEPKTKTYEDFLKEVEGK